MRFFGEVISGGDEVVVVASTTSGTKVSKVEVGELVASIGVRISFKISGVELGT